ncbi:MAG: energy-coupling factor transporter ATPase [Anaerovoracaceae bacterium]
MSIEVKNITHIYGEKTPHETKAIDDVSFVIDDGSFIGVIGHTGSGKSTLVQHLNGLLKPSSGEIIVDGLNITDGKTSMIDVRKKIGLVFQYPEYQLFEETVEKDVAFGPKNLGLDDEEISKRVKEAIELVSLDYEEIRNKSPFDLSGGQKRRVAIAGVIAMKPKVLILDEPTAGLDPKAHRDILKMIKNIHESENNIIVFVSHNMNDIANLSDKVVVMDKGKMVDFDVPSKVFADGIKLKKLGLGLPDVADLLAELKREGLGIQGNTFDIDEAFQQIKNKIKGGVSND